jgi:Ni,Fe-hydrogenase III large subunit/Ni,Fe-hydrogenase III component G
MLPPGSAETDMTAVEALIAQGADTGMLRPWRRVRVGRDAWAAAGQLLADGQASLIGLWGDDDAVHIALFDEQSSGFAILSHAVIGGRFPSIGRVHAPAIRPERAIHDLYGFEPEAAADLRPWLDHGRWGVTRPLGPAARTEPNGAAYAFLPAEGESLHQIPVGPVHAGIIEPGHFRFTANGETVVRLEERLGYVHKGFDALTRNADIESARHLAGRVSGDSTVAYALAFSRAVEAALGVDVPLRAHFLRALMAELERIANHLGDIGAICNDAAFTLMHAQCGILRERVLRVAHACFGHRLMMDRILPGGVAADLSPAGAEMLRATLGEIERIFPKLVKLYDNTASVQDRTVSTGVLKTELARTFAPGGYIGRASGRSFDARRTPGYPPYDTLDFVVPVEQEGDVNARVWVRIKEVVQSLALIGQILERLPDGPILRPGDLGSGSPSEGVSVVEGFRGDILVWLRLDGEARVARCHFRDPSWFQWPLLEAVIEGNIVADFPLCNKSFNCSYSGHDL